MWLMKTLSFLVCGGKRSIALTRIAGMQAEQATSRRRSRAGTKAQSGESAADVQEPQRDSVSRQRVVDAAIKCILDQGFYRASSNAIAEAAGASWGVIQYHFGNRETLMLAVLEEGARRLNETVLTADITGHTLNERVEQYMEILARYYGSPDYLVFIQVLINLTHDPRTSQQTRDTMMRINEAANPELRRLQRKVLAGTGIRRHAVRSLLFHALRGLALSHTMLATLPDQQDQSRQFAEQRRLLAEALATLFEQQRKPGS
jgi:AcrR family transcriptional regulator